MVVVSVVESILPDLFAGKVSGGVSNERVKTRLK